MKKLLLLPFIALTFVSCKKENIDPLSSTNGTNLQKSGMIHCGDAKITEIKAGQHHTAGSLSISNDQDSVYLIINMTGGWTFNKAHVAIGSCDAKPFSPAKPAPGQFPYHYNANQATYARYAFPLSQFSGTPCLCYAVHLEARKVENGQVVQSETAWGEGPRFAANGNWSMYNTYCIQECTVSTPNPTTDCLVNETAWAFGTRFNQNQGQWGWYLNYNNSEQTYNIYAGQHYLAAQAHFSAPVNNQVTITITMMPGYNLQDVNQSVKISGTDTAPSGNQAPGQFPYRGNNLVITVPVFRYYLIHLDALRPCDAIPAPQELPK